MDKTVTLSKNEIDEIIIATPFTPSGETTALYLERILNKDDLVISRIGYGLPAGGDIEYVDELTLKRAIDSDENFASSFDASKSIDDAYKMLESFMANK